MRFDSIIQSLKAASASWRTSPYAWFFNLPRKKQLIVIAGKLFIVVCIVVAYISSPPAEFPTNQIIVVPSGSGAQTFATVLKEHHVIRSRTAFLVLARLTRLDRSLDTGAYIFAKPLDVSGIVWRAGHSEHGVDSIRITLTEGMTIKDMAATLQSQLPGFNEQVFLSAASTSEGYLFPDTYLITPGTPEKDIVVRLRTEFSLQIATITPQIMSFKEPFDQDVVMASLIEREARTLPEKRMVAGILWKRIASDIPLQVDAAFAYAHGQSGYVPTASDTSLDSPYNTYTHRGLPPTPIANPGLESLLAAVTPTASPYLYYLTGKDGQMYYAKTYAEHQKNIEKYLK